MSKSIDCSIIIVSFNTKDILKSCLDAIKKGIKSSDSWEIIVVDNASSDGSVEMMKKAHPDVIVFAQKENVGFAAANNIGINASKGRYVLLLNSDTEVEEHAIRDMIVLLETHQDAVAATCTLTLPDGSIDPASHRGFPTPWAAFTYFSGLEKMFPKSALFGQYHQGYKNMAAVHEVDCISGAFFLIRRSVLDVLGLLDEDYFMYGEDIDWCYRIREHGWKILFDPTVSVLHKKKQSGRKSQNSELQKKTEQYFYNTMALFYKKHYQARYGWLTTKLVLLGIAIKSRLSTL